MRFKLGKKALTIIVVGIFAIVLGYLFVTYSQTRGEEGELNDRLILAQTQLPMLTAEKEDLETELDRVRSALARTQEKFPGAVESIEYGEHLFEITDESNLPLPSLSFPKPGARTDGPVTYSVVSLGLSLSGQLDDVFDFIYTLRTDPRFASTEVKSVSLSITGDQASASISIDIYGYKR